MPANRYASIQNPRQYRALRRRGFSKEAAARISNARTPGHRVKAEWGARSGQRIAGNLFRGAGGRFSSGPGGGAELTPRQRRQEEERARRLEEDRQEAALRAEEDERIAAEPNRTRRAALRRQIAAERRRRAMTRHLAREERRQQGEAQTRAERAAELARRAEERATKPKKGGGGGTGKPSDEEKRRQRDEKRAQMARETAGKVGLGQADLDALRLAVQGTPQATALTDRLGLTRAGEATDAGRQALRALERGDVAGYHAALQNARERQARDEERRRQAEERERARQQREQERRARAEARAREDAIRIEEDERIASTRTPEERRAIREEVRLARLARRRARLFPGRAVTTPPGSVAQRLPAKLSPRPPGERTTPATKAQRTFGGRKRADLPDSAFAGPDRSFPIITAQDVRDAVRSLGRTKHNRAAVKRGIIRRARAIGATSALPERWRTKGRSAFAVFKDARGADRWVSVSSSAYLDRDREIVSSQALAGAVAKADASGVRGPLRFWHLPGLDIGDCDFQMVAGPGGRFLVESGTFRDPRYARAIAGKALQVSIGFFHPRTEPRGGVFHDIAIFERSVVPDGRAANPMTRLTLKERRMSDEKLAAAKALFGEQLLSELLATVATTDKAAQDQGLAYKDDQIAALRAEVEALKATVKALTAPAETTEKAAPPPPEAEMAEADVAEADVAEAEMAEADDGPILGPADAQLIAEAVMAVIAPQLDLEKKMAGYLNEMKAMLAPQAAKDDERAREIAALRERLAALEGDMPRAAKEAAAVAGGATLPAHITVPQSEAPSDPLAAFLAGFSFGGAQTNGVTPGGN